MTRTEEVIKYNSERGCYEREFVEVPDYYYEDEVERLRSFNEELQFFMDSQSSYTVGYS